MENKIKFEEAGRFGIGAPKFPSELHIQSNGNVSMSTQNPNQRLDIKLSDSIEDIINSLQETAETEEEYNLIDKYRVTLGKARDMERYSDLF
jgi:hypothetical protein